VVGIPIPAESGNTRGELISTFATLVALARSFALLSFVYGKYRARARARAVIKCEQDASDRIASNMNACNGLSCSLLFSRQDANGRRRKAR